MADDLQFSVTANTQDLASSLQSIIDGLAKVISSAGATGDAVSTGMTKGAEATEKLASGARVAGAEMETAAKEAGGLGEALEGLGAHSRTVAMGLEAMGLSAEGSAAKVIGMSEALSGLGKAVPELLAIAVAFAAIAGALDFWKEATTDAEAMQDSMARLGAAVQNQGGNWAANKEAVEDWANSESVASGILKSELIPALNRVVSAGHDLHDSQIIVGVAEELVTQKHISLEQATTLLQRAETGRAQGLEKLDANLKFVINGTTKFSDILAKLHQDMQGAIQDDDSAAMTHRRLAAEMEQVSEVLGNVLLPYLEKLDATMIGAIKNAQDLTKAIGEMVAAILPSIKGLAELATRDYVDAFKDLGAGVHHITTGYKEWASMQDATARGEREIAKAIKEHQDALKNIKLDGLDETMGKEPAAKKASTGNPDATVSENIIGPDDIKSTDQLKVAQEALDDALAQGKAALEPYSEAVEESTTVQQKNAAQAALYTATVNELANAHTLLNNAVAKETQTQASLKSQYDTMLPQVQALGRAHDALAEKMLAEGGGTAQQKIDLADLNSQYQAGKKDLEEISQKQNENTEDLKKNTQALGENNKATVDLTSEHKKFLESLDEMRVSHQEQLQDEANTYGKSIALQVAYYQEQLALLDQNDKANEERIKQLNEDIFNAQLDGYKKLEEAQAAAQKKVVEDQTELDNQLKEERKKTLEEATKDVDTFLDDMLVKHESFATSLKGIMQQLQKQYVQSFSQMITGSSGFQKLFGGVTGNTQDPNTKLEKDEADLAQKTADLQKETATLGGNTETLNNSVGNLNTSSGTLNTSLGTVNSTIASQLVPALNKVTQAIGSAGSSGVGGSGGLDLNSPFSTALGNSNSFSMGSLAKPNTMAYLWNNDSASQYAADTSVAQTGAQGDASGIPADQINGSDNGLGATKSNGGGFGSYIGSAASIAGGLMTGNDTQVAAGVGGAIGTWIGTLGGATGGPLGGAIGTLLGTVLGSFIGPHPSAAQNPDLFESSTGYGATMADLVGVGINAAGANGTEYNTDSGTAAFIASQGITTPGINSKMTSNQDYSYGLQAMATYLDNYSATNLPPGISASQFASMQQILGTNPSDISFGTYNSNIGDLAVTGSNGTTDTTYSALGTYLQEIENSQSVAGGSTGVYSLTHSMPNFEKTTMQQIGTFTDGIYKGSTPTGTTPASSIDSLGIPGGPNVGSGSISPNPIVNGTPKIGNVTVNVTVPGVLVGSGGISELTTAIENQINKNLFNNAGNRNSGNY